MTYEEFGMQPRIVIMMTEDNPVGREYLKTCLENWQVVALVVESSEFAKTCLKYNTERMGGHYDPPTCGDLLDGTSIPMYIARKHHSPYVRNLLTSLAPDIVVAGGVGCIVREDMLEIPRYGFVSSHPGLLPKMRGSNPIAHAILNDYPQGATCHYLDPGIDTGPIIYRENLSVPRGYSYEQLEGIMLPHCGKILAKGIQRTLGTKGKGFEIQQPGEGTEYKKATEQTLASAKKKLLSGEYQCFED